MKEYVYIAFMLLAIMVLALIIWDDVVSLWEGCNE